MNATVHICLSVFCSVLFTFLKSFNCFQALPCVFVLLCINVLAMIIQKAAVLRFIKLTDANC